MQTLNLKYYLFPLFGRGGHPFLLDQKGRKNQGKTNCSARFPWPSAQSFIVLNGDFNEEMLDFDRTVRTTSSLK
jgi:hypothetical protein